MTTLTASTAPALLLPRVGGGDVSFRSEQPTTDRLPAGMLPHLTSLPFVLKGHDASVSPHQTLPAITVDQALLLSSTQQGGTSIGGGTTGTVNVVLPSDSSSVGSHGSNGPSDDSSSSTTSTSTTPRAMSGSQPLPLPVPQRLRLNKFVLRLHDMLRLEKDSGIVEWRRGLLVLHSTDAFAKSILPKHFNTRNFKTFRRQLNYYGFIHVRSFSTTGSTTTALWVNRDLASSPGSDDIDAVLTLRRVEPCESAKTVDGRRSRKEQALHTVEEDLGVSAKSLQMDQIRHLAWQHVRGDNDNDSDQNGSTTGGPSLWSIMVCVPSDPPALNLALRPPPPLALLPSPILPVEVKTKTTATKSPNRDDDQASAANLLLLLSKAS